MVETYIGNDAEERTDDVGAVEAAAQTYFNDGHINLTIGKVLVSHGGGQFEERGMQWFKEGALTCHKVDNILLWNHFSIDADTFTEIYQVR